MLGQPASSQTVCSPSLRTRVFSCVYDGPVRSLVLIHGGFRSIGTWLVRASRRSIRRPSGASTTPSEYVAGRRKRQRGRHDLEHDVAAGQYLRVIDVTRAAVAENVG